MAGTPPDRRNLRIVVFAAALLAFAAWYAALAWIGTRDHAGHAALIVVPATAVRADGELSARLRARCDRALAEWKAGTAPVLFLSGGVDPRGHDEARCMATYLERQGVPRTAIVTDSLGVDSWETVEHARAWLAAHRATGVVLVSQGFHVPRLRLACRRLGVAPAYYVHARFWEPRDVYSVAREFPAIIKYFGRRR